MIATADLDGAGSAIAEAGAFLDVAEHVRARGGEDAARHVEWLWAKATDELEVAANILLSIRKVMLREIEELGARA